MVLLRKLKGSFSLVNMQTIINLINMYTSENRGAHPQMEENYSLILLTCILQRTEERALKWKNKEAYVWLVYDEHIALLRDL